MGERWQALVGFPRYEVSDLGRVRHRETKRIRKLQMSHQGRPVTYLTDATGRNRIVPIHSAVLTAFVGPRPYGCDASHINGTRTDNRLANLCWETPGVNHRRKLAHGTLVHGEKHKCSKLKAVQVRNIRQLADRGTSYSVLSDRYGVSVTRIGMIVRGEAWKHIGA